MVTRWAAHHFTIELKIVIVFAKVSEESEKLGARDAGLRWVSFSILKNVYLGACEGYSKLLRYW